MHTIYIHIYMAYSSANLNRKVVSIRHPALQSTADLPSPSSIRHPIPPPPPRPCSHPHIHPAPQILTATPLPPRPPHHQPATCTRSPTCTPTPTRLCTCVLLSDCHDNKLQGTIQPSSSSASWYLAVSHCVTITRLVFQEDSCGPSGITVRTLLAPSIDSL